MDHDGCECAARRPPKGLRANELCPPGSAPVLGVATAKPADVVMEVMPTAAPNLKEPWR